MHSESRISRFFTKSDTGNDIGQFLSQSLQDIHLASVVFKRNAGNLKKSRILPKKINTAENIQKYLQLARLPKNITIKPIKVIIV